MEWIDQEYRKPKEHIRVLVYVRRPCAEKGALQGMTFAAWHGERGWIGDYATPLKGVTHWAVIAPPVTMNRPTFDIDALDLDRLEWLSLEDYEPPFNKWVVTRWESEIIDGLYAISAVYYNGWSWYNADGEEVEVTEFAEVEG